MAKLKFTPMSNYDKPGNKAVNRTLTVEITFENGDKEVVTTSCCNDPDCNPLIQICP